MHVFGCGTVASALLIGRIHNRLIERLPRCRTKNMSARRTGLKAIVSASSTFAGVRRRLKRGIHQPL